MDGSLGNRGVIPEETILNRETNDGQKGETNEDPKGNNKDVGHKTGESRTTRFLHSSGKLAELDSKETDV